MRQVVLLTLTYLLSSSPGLAGPVVYWSENFGQAGGGAIRRLNLDGASTVETVRSGSVRTLVIDGGSIYATENARIVRLDVDGSDFESLITTPGSASWGTALDANSGQIYWSDRDTGTVYRGNFDGSGVTSLLTVPSGFQLRDIDLDLANHKIYIADSAHGAIWEANLDGTLMDFYYGRAAGPWWGIAMDQALNVSGMLTEGGGFLQPTEQEAAAVAMMTAHIQYDLRAALAMEGVGSDAGFKCVGKVVAECAAKLGKPDWMTRAGGAMFPALDPMRLRDQMRSQVRQRLSTQYPNRDIRYEGGREAIISHDLDYLRKNCGAN